MTNKEFSKGLGILTSFGFPLASVDDDTIGLWFEVLQGTEFEKYRKAIIALCQKKTTWYPSDNVPALILEQVKLIPKARIYHKAEPKWLEMREENMKRLLKQGGE